MFDLHHFHNYWLISLLNLSETLLPTLSSTQLTNFIFQGSRVFLTFQTKNSIVHSYHECHCFLKKNCGSFWMSGNKGFPNSVFRSDEIVLGRRICRGQPLFRLSLPLFPAPCADMFSVKWLTDCSDASKVRGKMPVPRAIDRSTRRARRIDVQKFNGQIRIADPGFLSNRIKCHCH